MDRLQNLKHRKIGGKKRRFERFPLSGGWCRLLLPGSLRRGIEQSLRLLLSSCSMIGQHFGSYASRNDTYQCRFGPTGSQVDHRPGFWDCSYFIWGHSIRKAALSLSFNSVSGFWEPLAHVACARDTREHKEMGAWPREAISSWRHCNSYYSTLINSLQNQKAKLSNRGTTEHLRRSFTKFSAFMEYLLHVLCDPMDCIPPGSSVHGIL